MSRTVRYAVLALVLASLGVWALRGDGPDSPGGASAAADAPQAGGTLVATIRSEPRTFNPLLAHDVASSLVAQLTHARLVRINPATQEWEPWLVERWAAVEEGRVYDLTLREGITFSDGTPFTVDDVLFAFEAVYDERVASPLADALRVGGKPLVAEAVDDRTVRVTFPSPFGPGLRLLDSLPIPPRARLEPALREGTFAAAWGLTTPAAEMSGLGPFVFDEYVPGQRVRLSKNARYWRAGEDGAPLPYLDGIVLEITPEQNTEILRLETGQADLIQSEIRPEDYSGLKRAASEGRVRLTDLGVGLDPSFFWINLTPSAAKDSRAPWLQHVDFRRAISHAVDRQSFADTVFLGAGVPVFGPVTPANRLWHSPGARKYEYDPARARALLASLGLADRTGDGLLEDGAGRPVRFALLTQKGNTTRERGAAVLQEDLREVGVAMDVVTLDVGSLVDRFGRGDYDAIYFATLASDTDPAVNMDFWLSSGSFHVWNPGQSTPATEWERRIDELMQRQVATPDYATRKALFDEVQAIFAEHTPVLYFVAPRVIVATSSRLLDVEPVILQPQVLWNAERLRVVRAPVPTAN